MKYAKNFAGQAMAAAKVSQPHFGQQLVKDVTNIVCFAQQLSMPRTLQARASVSCASPCFSPLCKLILLTDQAQQHVK
jgi:hypothetical protein